MATEKRLIDAQKFGMFLADTQLANRGWRDDVCELLDDIMEALDKQSTVDAAEVVHGRWEGSRDNLYGEYTEMCSVCKSWSRAYGSPYCPNCGAKMDGDGNG